MCLKCLKAPPCWTPANWLSKLSPAGPTCCRLVCRQENTRIALEGSRNNLSRNWTSSRSLKTRGAGGDRNPVATSPDLALLGGYGGALGQVFRRNYPVYGAGIQLNLPLRNRTAQADAARDEIVSRQADIRAEEFRTRRD